LCVPACQPILDSQLPNLAGAFPGVSNTALSSCLCAPGADLSTMSDFSNPGSAGFNTAVTTLCLNQCQPLLSASLAGQVGSLGSCSTADGYTCCVCADPIAILTASINSPSTVMSTMNSLPACEPIIDSFLGTCPSQSPTCPNGLPGSGSSGSSDDPCFPSSARVTRADGSKVTVDALRSGDAIVAVTAKGELTTDTVSLLSIVKPEVAATDFLVLTATADKAHLVNLTVTAAHHVPVGAACCSTLKQAGEVEIGETIYTIKNGVAAPSTVTKVAKAVKAGLHSPVLTNGHFPVIDDTVTAFDSATKMHLASYALPILEPACKATGTCASLKKLVGKITGRKY